MALDAKTRAGRALSTVTRGRLGTPPQTKSRRTGILAALAALAVVGAGVVAARAANKRYGARLAEAVASRRNDGPAQAAFAGGDTDKS